MLPIGFGEVSEQLRRSTVQIQTGRCGGSGVIWNSSGTIITNSHVVDRDHARIVLWDGRQMNATVEDRDSTRDLARVQVGALDLPAVRVRPSNELRTGELLVAVGNPFGFIGAVTTGIVHRVGPFLPVSHREWVQADVRLAPGNSGGPLADAQGRLVGINTMVAGGLALAIPSDTVSRFVQRSAAPAPRLGVTVRPVHTPRGFGWLVLEIEPGSAAERASLLPGDLLVGAGGKPISHADELGESLAAGVVTIQFYRPGSERLREAYVAAQNSRAEAA